MPILGRATAEGTARYAARAVASGLAVPGHFRDSTLGLRLSTVGLGTYRGAVDDATDAEYEAAVIETFHLGGNVLDSAINYRCQRSERAIGTALAVLGPVRDEVVVTTKGGYLAANGRPVESSVAFRAEVLAPALADGLCLSDLANGRHAIAPAFLSAQIGRSLANLGLATIDVYYLHNPEEQLAAFGRPEFERRLRAALERLEGEADTGRIVAYGTATWSGYRSPVGSAKHLDLVRVVEIAREVAGERHRLRALQLPYNPRLTQAADLANQRRRHTLGSTLEVAADLGLTVFASASIGEGRLPVAEALQAVRSTRGVACALVGMRQIAHVRSNLSLAKRDPDTR